MRFFLSKAKGVGVSSWRGAGAAMGSLPGPPASKQRERLTRSGAGGGCGSRSDQVTWRADRPPRLALRLLPPVCIDVQY